MPPAAVLPNGVLPQGVEPNGTSESVFACGVVRELSVPTGWSGTGVVPSDVLPNGVDCTAGIDGPFSVRSKSAPLGTVRNATTRELTGRPVSGNRKYSPSPEVGTWPTESPAAVTVGAVAGAAFGSWVRVGSAGSR